MTDYFACLGVPRRPWVDADILKEKFLARSRQVHPDHASPGDASEQKRCEDASAELNAAVRCLAEPRSRLRHLVELETGGKPEEVGQVPNGLMDLFFRTGAIIREADATLSRKEAMQSPLLQVRFFEESQAVRERLVRFNEELDRWGAGLLKELKDLDDTWQPAMPGQAQKLSELYRRFSYHHRWSEQVRERIVRLSL